MKKILKTFIADTKTFTCGFTCSILIGFEKPTILFSPPTPTPPPSTPMQGEKWKEMPSDLSFSGESLPREQEKIP